MKELTKSRNKSRAPPALMTRKNLKKDFQSSLEVSEFSRLEVDLKLKLVKLRTEFKMPSVPPEQLWKRVLSSVVVALFCMLHEPSTTSSQSTRNKLWVSTSSKKPLPFHARQLQTTQVSKE